MGVQGPQSHVFRSTDDSSLPRRAQRWRVPAVRSFATVVEAPSIDVDELPEPLLSKGKETISDTLEVTVAAEKVGRFRSEGVLAS